MYVTGHSFLKELATVTGHKEMLKEVVHTMSQAIGSC